ncbi:hypothetical protein [Kitasatospora purpeofusca]|uniref:hypothetical protein n=1 Tax=Kitasatospora purpeofusca TaxID=67352 RepID=UPI0004C16353|nr:hypothetical protein [Kitasatospora purpeofusca]
MTTSAPKTGDIYISCAEGRFIRVTAYTPGDTEATVEDAEFGYRLAPVPLRLFHDSIRTTRGQLRRIGYAPQPDGVPPWTERLRCIWGDVHAARRLLTRGLVTACGAATDHHTGLGPDAGVTCHGCRQKIDA